MDIATLIGIVLCFGLIIGSIMLNGSITAFIDTPSLLIVVGGTNDGGKMTSRAQLLALTPYADPGCFSLPDFPVALEGAVGANINGVPTVCGGRLRDARYTRLIL